MRGEPIEFIYRLFCLYYLKPFLTNLMITLLEHITLHRLSRGLFLVLCLAWQISVGQLTGIELAPIRIEMLPDTQVTLPFHTSIYEIRAKVYASNPERFAIRFFSDNTPLTRRSFASLDSIVSARWCIATFQKWQQHRIYAVVADNFHSGFSNTLLVDFQHPEIPTGWQYFTTNSVAYLHIPLATQPTLDNIPIEKGDYIGVFYDSMGIRRVAGVGIWEGKDLTIKVFGAHNGRNGIERNEKMRFWLWKKDRFCFSEHIEVAFAQPAQAYFSENSHAVVTSFKAFSTPFDFDIKEACANHTRMIQPATKIAFNYSFEAPEGLAIDEQSGYIYPDKSREGVYPVRIHSANCLTRHIDTITIRAVPQIQLVDTLTTCFDSLVVQAKQIPTWRYSWESGSRTHQSVVRQTGYHRVVVIDEYGCINRDSVYAVVRGMNPDKINVTILPTSCKDSTADIVVGVKGLSPKKIDFQLLTLEGDSMLSAFNRFSDVKVGYYRLRMRHLNGCQVDYPKFLHVSPPRGCVHHILAPDLSNQAGVIPFTAAGKVQIYDRNGVLVKELVTPAFWDGTDNHNQPVSMGVYIAISSDGQEMQITVLR